MSEGLAQGSLMQRNWTTIHDLNFYLTRYSVEYHFLWSLLQLLDVTGSGVFKFRVLSGVGVLGLYTFLWV